MRAYPREEARNVRKRCVPDVDERKRKRLIGGLSEKKKIRPPRNRVRIGTRNVLYSLSRARAQISIRSRFYARACTDTQTRALYPRPCARSSASGEIANRLDLGAIASFEKDRKDIIVRLRGRHTSAEA